MACAGLVTSEGAHWKRQRTLLSHALRIDILEDTAVRLLLSLTCFSCILHVCITTWCSLLPSVPWTASASSSSSTCTQRSRLKLAKRYTCTYPSVFITPPHCVTVPAAHARGYRRAHSQPEPRRVSTCVPRPLPPHCGGGQPQDLGAVPSLPANARSCFIVSTNLIHASSRVASLQDGLRTTRQSGSSTHISATSFGSDGSSDRSVPPPFHCPTVLMHACTHTQLAVRAGTQNDSKDILERILASLDPGAWSEATVLQLRDEIKTFILAGHETSAAMMTWVIYEYTQDSQCRKTATDEALYVIRLDVRGRWADDVC